MIIRDVFRTESSAFFGQGNRGHPLVPCVLGARHITLFLQPDGHLGHRPLGPVSYTHLVNLEKREQQLRLRSIIFRAATAALARDYM